MTLATFSASDVTVAEFSKCCDNNVSNGSILPRMFSTTAVQPPPKKKKEQMAGGYQHYLHISADWGRPLLPPAAHLKSYALECH